MAAATRSATAAESSQGQASQQLLADIHHGPAQDLGTTLPPPSAPAQDLGTALPPPSAPLVSQPAAPVGGTLLPLSDQAPYLGLTREQMNAKFAMEQRKLELEMAAIEAQTVRENEESRARISAMQAVPTATTAPRASGSAEEEEPIGEISPATLLVASRYPGLPKAEIARIFANKFRPKTLPRLRHLKGREDKDREENVTIENGQMKLKPSNVHLRDFGTTWEIWSEAFINYCMILVDFFGATFPSLSRVLLLFHQRIRKLTRIYEWQGAICPLVVDFHTEITTASPTNVDAWNLPQYWIDLYCSPQFVLNKKRTAAAALDGPAAKKPRTSEICRNFNDKGCSYGDKCYREHKCLECGSKDHGAQACTKRKQ